MVSLSPELHQRLPIPGGLERAQAVYTFLEDQPTLGRRFFVITKPEGDQSASSSCFPSPVSTKYAPQFYCSEDSQVILHQV